jgi:uncharacterized membrane protein YbhN (UPF0104 family)
LPRRLARAFLSLAVVVAAFAFGLPEVAAYDTAWEHVDAMSRPAKVALVLAAGWNLATYWFLLVVALPGLTIRQAAVSSQASTAVANTVPGGGALGAAVTWTMYRRWGFDGESIARSLAVTGAWNVFVKLSAPAAALAVIVLEGHAGDGAVAIAVVSTLVLVVCIGGFGTALRRPGAVRRVAALVEQLVARARPAARRDIALTERAEAAVARARELITHRWRALSVAAVVSHASLFLVLLVALRAVGVRSEEVTTGEALTAFAVVRAVLVVPITPGGAGLTEVGLAGLLDAAGGRSSAVVAGVLVYRAVTWLLPVLLGFAAYGAWVRERRPRAALAP